MARRTLIISYIATYLIALGSIFRLLLHFQDKWQISIILLIAAYIVLLILEPTIISRKHAYSFIYFFIQAAIITTISIITPRVDYWSALFIPLVVQAMYRFRQRVGFIITGLLAIIMAISMFLGLGPGVGLPILMINIVIYFFAGAFIAIARDAEAARMEIQRQQNELQAAHQQLQIYAAQAEESAIRQERGRLARELHDSVTQSLHSATLLAEAGQRLASTGDIDRARGYLIRLREICHQALMEMRLLVYELRPLVLSEIGLKGALQQRLDAVERRAGVEAVLHIEEGIEIPPKIEEELFRIAMESLNNSLKHAGPTTVTISLCVNEKRDTPCFELEILDDGKGFEINNVEDSGGLGFVSMQERIDALGGELTIQSTPGEGTRVRACVDIVPPSSSNTVKDAI